MDSSILVAIISVIGSFVLVYLSTVKEMFSTKYNARKEQLEKFYIPFYQKYCAGFLSINELSSMSPEARGFFLDLLTQNLHLIEPKSQAMYQDFYMAFLNLLEAYDNNPDFPFDKTAKEFDIVFRNLTSEIFKEYRCILKKCHLPVPLLKDL